MRLSVDPETSVKPGQTPGFRLFVFFFFFVVQLVSEVETLYFPHLLVVPADRFLRFDWSILSAAQRSDLDSKLRESVY